MEKDKSTPEGEMNETTKAEKGGFMESIEKMDENIKEKIEETNKKVSESIDKGVKKTRSFVRKLFLAAFVAFLLSGVVYMLYANYTYSEGTRAGDLIKISRKGYVFKTYEGQLKLGGIDLTNPEEGLSDTWSFSVSDEAIVKQLEKLQGEKVVLRYKEINQAMPWQGETNYFIYSIE